jgi:hypothetical protein
MKWVLKAMGYGLILALLAGLLALMAVIRFAGSDPQVWHVRISDGAPVLPGTCLDLLKTLPNGARVTCGLPQDPVQVLTRLATIAEAYPRTTRLAGSPQDGLITWVSRTLIMGYPDYITAEVTQTATGTRLDIFSRQRFGRRDRGVNAARLGTWLAALDQPS